MTELEKLRAHARLGQCLIRGCVCEINRIGAGRNPYSAKATEVEAGQRPVPPRATPAQSGFAPLGEFDGLVYLINTPSTLETRASGKLDAHRPMPSLRHLLAEHPTLLMIDAASTRVQVGLWHQGLVSWQVEEAEAGTAVFACTEKLLAAHNLTIADLNAYVFCEGPGSVLGIRTSAVALRTWRVLKPAPSYAYQSLTLAAHALDKPEVNVIADARRDSWHVQRLGETLRRVPTSELTGECVMPEGFRHWTPLPPALGRTPYDLPALLALPALLDADLFHLSAEPDAFMHEEPSYVTWTPQVHQAPAR